MGQREDRIEIAKALAAANFVITGNEIQPIALDVMVEDLVAYGVDAVRAALTRCRRECRGRMALADILDRLTAADGRPDADEAWMTALQAEDESATVVWSNETAQAFSIARPALEIRDKIGARMAFKAAYDRLVQDARERGEPAKWSASLGWDAEQRRNVQEAAVACNRLPASHAAGLLPAPKANPDVAKAILQLACVNGENVNQDITDREIGRRKLAELRAMLEDTQEKQG